MHDTSAKAQTEANDARNTVLVIRGLSVERFQEAMAHLAPELTANVHVVDMTLRQDDWGLRPQSLVERYFLPVVAVLQGKLRHGG